MLVSIAGSIGSSVRINVLTELSCYTSDLLRTTSSTLYTLTSDSFRKAWSSGNAGSTPNDNSKWCLGGGSMNGAIQRKLTLR